MSSDPIFPPTRADGTPIAYVTVDATGGGRPSDTHVRLSTGHSLGHVQSVKWQLAIGDAGARCEIVTILDAAELVTLVSNTTIKVRLWENPVPVLWAYCRYRLRRFFRSH